MAVLEGVRSGWGDQDAKSQTQVKAYSSKGIKSMMVEGCFSLKFVIKQMTS
jgi:hypothetical protein